MKFYSIILASAIGVATTQAAKCSPVHIIVARASNEEPGTGIIGSLAELVYENVPGTTVEALDYPATLYNYEKSSSKGVAAMKTAITRYIQSCPQSKIVLMGYSQGAHVIGDALCGGGAYRGLGPASAALNPEANSHIAAIVQMGDPRFTAGLSYDVGTATRDGVFPRPQSQNCNAYADRIASYCDATDKYCDSGNSHSVHQSYTRRYNGKALAFILSKLGVAGPPL